MGQQLYRAYSVIGNAHFMSHGLEQPLQCLGLVPIVVNDNNSKRGGPSSHRRLCGIGLRDLRWRSERRERQPDDKFAAVPKSVASRFDTAAVKLHDVANQRQSQT